jgi:hypothetical protein
MKRVFIALLILVLIIFAGCDSESGENGLIEMSINDLNLLPGVLTDTSIISCSAYTNDGTDYTEISESVSLFSPIDSYSFTFILGDPDYEFTAGTKYYIGALIDADGDGIYDEADTDYWLTYFEIVTIDGDQTITVDNTYFELRS